MPVYLAWTDGSKDNGVRTKTGQKRLRGRLRVREGERTLLELGVGGVTKLGLRVWREVRFGFWCKRQERRRESETNH